LASISSSTTFSTALRPNARDLRSSSHFHAYG
jgi:hypothetical protein